MPTIWVRQKRNFRNVYVLSRASGQRCGRVRRVYRVARIKSDNRTAVVRRAFFMVARKRRGEISPALRVLFARPRGNPDDEIPNPRHVAFTRRGTLEIRTRTKPDESSYPTFLVVRKSNIIIDTTAGIKNREFLLSPTHYGIEKDSSVCVRSGINKSKTAAERLCLKF